MAITSSLQSAFDTWTDGVLRRKIPKGTIAFHFNLYEGVGAFHVQLVGAAEFSRDDPDWPCAETFTTGEDILELPHSVVGTKWENCLEVAKQLVQCYLAKGRRAAALRASRGVGVGFVDGDIDIVWESNAT
jgi:hypothetical protein